MKKRIISLLLCLVMVGLLPVTAYADMNMGAYEGKRITHIELEASVDDPIITAGATDSYAESRNIAVGEAVKNGEKTQPKGSSSRSRA